MSGGKGSDGGQAPTFAPQQQGPDMEQMFMAYSEMMGGMMESQAAQIQQLSQQQQPMLPPIFEGPEVDFGKAEQQLRQQAAGTYNAELAQKKGLEDTVWSVLQDDEDEVATTTVLG